MVSGTQHLLCIMQLRTVKTEYVNRVFFQRRAEHDIIESVYVFKVIRECDGALFS